MKQAHSTQEAIAKVEDILFREQLKLVEAHATLEDFCNRELASAAKNIRVHNNVAGMFTKSKTTHVNNETVTTKSSDEDKGFTL